MKHGNLMLTYNIIRKHDFKIVAQVKGYNFARILKGLYENKFPQNTFILSKK